VTWIDAVRFCNALSIREGLQPVYSIEGANVACDWTKKGYRLPTEAEWEYATRGGSKGRGYSYSGSANLDEVAWHDGNSGGLVHDVGQKKPNELGIYDMSGNAWEWCWDWLGEYAAESRFDTRGPASGTVRVTRGGSEGGDGQDCMTITRNGSPPDTSYRDLGFRLARSVAVP